MVLQGTISAILAVVFSIVAIFLWNTEYGFIFSLALFTISLILVIRSIWMFSASKGSRNYFSAEISEDHVEHNHNYLDTSITNFCPYCGATAAVGHVYCKSCGKEMV